MNSKSLQDLSASADWSTKLIRMLFWIYVAGLFWLIVLKFNVAFLWLGEERSLNLIPYAEPLILNGRIDVNEMILNALVFLPFGVYTGILYRGWTIRKHILLFFSFSLLCEIFQYILAVGAADITDLINNTLGGWMGLMIVKGMEKLTGDVVKTRKILTAICAVGMLLLISFFIFLRVKELWMFRMYTIPDKL